MRKAATEFNILHPTRRYRHEKPDLKVLLEKKDENYVDVGQAIWTQFENLLLLWPW